MRFFSPLLLIPLLTSLQTIQAAADTLYVSSVSYCSNTTAVEISQFSLTYFKANQSVYFTFNLASVESIPESSIDVSLNVYGRQITNQTVDLCSLIYGVLCPLPQVNFTGGGTYQLDSSVTSGIPDLAWTVPNIEAYARLELISTTTGQVATCLQATLSNGLTVQHNYVALISSLITLLALLVGIFHAALAASPSPAQYRWFDFLYLFQTAVSTGLLNLNYPLVYQAFVQNFAWSFGLFYSGNIENSITKMRSNTGGHLSTSTTPQYIDTQLSPYNYQTMINLNEVTATASSFNSFLSRFSTSSGLTTRALSTQLDTTSTANTAVGIPAYVDAIQVPRVNAYDTIFFVFLALIAIAIAFHLILFIFVFIFDRIGRSRRGVSWYWNFCMGNALRVCLIGFLPIWVFAFYQFTIGTADSGLSIFFAVFGILITLVPLAVVFILSIFKARRRSSTAPDVSRLYTSWRWFHSAGAMYRPYRQRFHFTWFAPLVLAMIARAGFIAFGSSNPFAQVVGCMAIEFIVLLYLLITRPHKDKKGDWLSVILCFLRLAAFGLLIAFITSVGVGAITRAIIGFVLIAVFGIPFVLLFIGLIWNAGYGYLWRRHKRRVEDGIEVEDEYLADDDSQRPAMAERGIGATGMESTRASTIIPDGSGSGAAPTRRTSIMEPVGEGMYENQNYPSNGSYNDHSNQTSEEAYAAASRGSYIDRSNNQYPTRPASTDYSSQNGHNPVSPVMARNNTSSTRPTSGYSEYFTPTGLPSVPVEDSRYPGPRSHYFDPPR